MGPGVWAHPQLSEHGSGTDEPETGPLVPVLGTSGPGLRASGALSGCQVEPAASHLPKALHDLGCVLLSQITRYVADISRARRLLGYEPTTFLQEGVRKAVEWSGVRAQS